MASPILASPSSMNFANSRRIAPHHAEAAIAHEVLELLGVVDLLQRRGEFRRRRRLRQALRARDAAPGADRIVDAGGFLEGRHVLEDRVALGRHDGERARLAGLDDRARLGNRAGAQVEAAGREILHRGRGAVRRHPADVIGREAHRLEPADQREMPDAALAGAGGLQLAGRRGLDGVGELLDGLVGRRRAHRDAGRVFVHQRERRVALRGQAR